MPLPIVLHELFFNGASTQLSTSLFVTREKKINSSSPRAQFCVSFLLHCNSTKISLFSLKNLQNAKAPKLTKKLENNKDKDLTNEN
jgi:hypothetical protein